ncbi:histone H1.3-like [Topomyia yanbarensis]|uniref:histone H1.3-like n=1 Tax=Topomyia yanbarensis TaxID=2498891 RepID=UPI00273C8D82|nr:histone H1.3-like [Topomyia yanbarensis]
MACCEHCTEDYRVNVPSCEVEIDGVVTDGKLMCKQKPATAGAAAAGAAKKPAAAAGGAKKSTAATAATTKKAADAAAKAKKIAAGDKKAAAKKPTVKKPAAKKGAPTAKKPGTATAKKATAPGKKSATGKKPVAGKGAAGKKPVAKKAAPAAKGDKKTVEAKVQKGAAKARAAALLRAKRTKTKVVKGPFGTELRRIRTTVKFRRPRTLRLPRNPKFPRKSVPTRSRMDAYSIIKYPLTTEAAMKKIEDNNNSVSTLLYRCPRLRSEMNLSKEAKQPVLRDNTTSIDFKKTRGGTTVQEVEQLVKVKMELNLAEVTYV